MKSLSAILFHEVTLIIFAFALLIIAWTTIVKIAIRHRAEHVPLQHTEHVETLPARKS